MEESDDIFHEPEQESDTEAKKQLNGELKDKADEEVPGEEAPVAPEDAGHDLKGDVNGSTKEGDGDSGNDDDLGQDDDEGGEDGEEYSVETIRDHKFSKGQTLYLIKWQGYGEEENTWEPEDHLIPHSRAVLKEYHKKIGGKPVPPPARIRSKQKLRETPSSEEHRASKRRKRNKDVSASPAEETTEESWLPEGEDWEDQVASVEMVDQDDNGLLHAYIKFKNGRRTRVGMDKIYKHCPRPMLRFYEGHLRFR
ncbi:uncharacterized protein A1O5_11703 [Cladophialophora psammophila CBS 110553]|uniref:Chromo domain-containing protein n=1 Tax=Cladophialophora psammophila CBS 110553 TaxID=1182543 RepID=W9WSU8_9EURO|nr:uncharacterized protein A1O5_11703 [Cladophialophora psammophila CBS 110553]EXJ61389.1 hypothetical protein A1O5_11703 [Cladophialophora psammophila CBS 110553]